MRISSALAMEIAIAILYDKSGKLNMWYRRAQAHGISDIYLRLFTTEFSF